MANQFQGLFRSIGVVTPVLVFANAVVYVVMGFSGVPWLHPSPEQQIAWGGNLAALTLTGDPWRLVTSMFLHGGLLHLAMNMYMLALIGRRAERQFGRVGMLAIYLLGGMLASCASASWLGFRAVSVDILGREVTNAVVSLGASGAIMATCGALLAAAAHDAFHANESLHEAGFGAALAQVVAINLAMGFFVSGIDQAAHVGGLIAGGFLGLAIGTANMRTTLAAQAARIAPTVLVALACIWAVLHLNDRQELRDLRDQVEQQAQTERNVRDGKTIKSTRALASERERGELPEPVSEEAARGQVIPFGQSGVSFALSTDEKRAYALDHYRNQVSVIDLATGAVERQIAGPQIPIAQLHGDWCIDIYCGGPSAADIVVLRDQPLALVSSMHQDAVDFVDLSEGRIVRTVQVGKAPNAIALSPDQGRAYVHNTGDHSISVVDVRTGAVLGALEYPSMDDRDHPGERLAMWFNADGSRLFAVDRITQRVDAYDTKALVKTGSENFGDRMYRVTRPAGQSEDLLGLASGRIYVMDETGAKTKSVWEFCNGMGGSELTAVKSGRTGGRIAIAAMSNNARQNDMLVSIVSLYSMASIGRYPVAGIVMKFQFSADGKKLFAVTNTGRFVVIDPLRRMAADEKDGAMCAAAG